MIIKGHRIRRQRGARSTIAHIFGGEENDQIGVIQGCEQDAEDAFSDARRHNRTFALRHWIIAPSEEMTRDQMVDVAKMLCAEFGAEFAPTVIVEHEKPRDAEEAFPRHLHVLAPETGPHGRVLDSRHSYARHAKIARKAEYKFGHRLLWSPHHLAIIQALQLEGQLELVTALSALTPENAGPTFAHADHQRTARLGIDLADLRRRAALLWQEAPDRSAFEQRLADLGFVVVAGDKADFIVTRKADGTFVASLARLVRAKQNIVRQRMENWNGTGLVPSADHRRENLKQPASPEGRTGSADQGHANRAVPGPAASHRPDARPADQDSGRHRAASSGPGRQSARRDDDRFRDQARLPDLTFALAAGRRSNVILDLIARARRQALPPDQRVDLELTELREAAEQARQNYERGLAPTAALLEARKGEKDAKAMLAAAETELARITEKCSAASRSAGLWAKLFGNPDRMGNDLLALQAQREQAKQAVDTGTQQLRNAEIARVQAENAFRQQASECLKAWRPRAEASDRTIASVKRARVILRGSPAIARCGVANVLMIERASDTTTSDSEIDYLPWYDLWGIPHPRRPR